MKSVALRAHFDGQQIRLDEPFTLEPGTQLTVVVPAKDEDAERHDWLLLSSSGLEATYGENEPDYTQAMIKESNPDYEGG
jgi:hypothetical protein